PGAPSASRPDAPTRSVSGYDARRKQEDIMRRLFAAVAVCALIGIGTARGEDSVKEKQVRATSDAWVAAWNRHDPKSMAAAWTPEGALINPFGRLATGRAEIEKLFTEAHATFMKGTTYSITNYKVRFPSPAIGVADYD